jgi:hypothetical protein
MIPDDLEPVAYDPRQQERMRQAEAEWTARTPNINGQERESLLQKWRLGKLDLTIRRADNDG